MTETIAREQLNEIIGEFADKIMNALGVPIADEEPDGPELTDTCFKVTDLSGNEMEVDAVDVNTGTVIADGVYEYFRCHQEGETGPWVRYTGESYTHEEFAEEMRNTYKLPCIVHYG